MNQKEVGVIITLSIIVCIVFGLFYYINYPQYTKTITVNDFDPYVAIEKCHWNATPEFVCSEYCHHDIESRNIACPYSEPPGPGGGGGYVQEGDHWIKIVGNYTVLMWNSSSNVTGWTYPDGVNKELVTDPIPLPQCSGISALRVGGSCDNGEYPIITCRQEETWGGFCYLVKVGQVR